MPGLFERQLKHDSVIAGAIAREMGRQRSEIELIASENIVSPAVLAAQGSVMTNKYAEAIRAPLLWWMPICRSRRGRCDRTRWNAV